MAEGLAPSLESDPNEGRYDKRRRIDDGSTTEGTIHQTGTVVPSPSPSPSRSLPRPPSFSSESDMDGDTEITSQGLAPIDYRSRAEGTIHQIGTVAINGGCGTGGTSTGNLLVSRTVIGKGSNGTLLFEGTYDGEPVAVKRIVRGHRSIGFYDIHYLMANQHPNIVRYCGVTFDQDFVFLGLERCNCSLHDLIVALSPSLDFSILSDDKPDLLEYKNKLKLLRDTMQDVKLWIDGVNPSLLLLNLMRQVVLGLRHLHGLELINGYLKPSNILITGKPLVPKLSDMGIGKWGPTYESISGYHATSCGDSGWRAPEQLLNERQTPTMDVFNLGCVLFFCLTGGRHPFGEGLECDINIKNNKKDLSSVITMPEAHDLISRLLNPLPELRPKASEVLHHPLFWSSERDETVLSS